MVRVIGVLLISLLFSVHFAAGADLLHLADCSSGVFNEINRSKAWSGKRPEGCRANVKVNKTADGVQVVTWDVSRGETEWVMTTFTALMSYREIADSTTLEKENRDLRTRARRLGNCLSSILKQGDPLECRYKASKEYYAGEKMGTERHWKIWLDDAGRTGIVDFRIGDTEKIPYPPADLAPGESLPPGTDLHLYIR